MPIILLRGGSIVNQAFDIGHMMYLINRLYYPNGAKVEDAPDPRRPRANAVCCCFTAAIYCELWHALVYTRAGDWGILGFPGGSPTL